MKLALGTVQFGLPYGVTNSQGKVAASTVRAILERAAATGIEVLDTAAAYGDSEHVLGQSLPAGHSFRLVSKTEPLRLQGEQDIDLGRVAARVRVSLRNLGMSRLSALLVHHAQDMLGANGEALFAELQKLQAEGLVERLGVSVYTTDELASVLARCPVQVVQLPLNVLDQSFVAGNALADLKRRGIEVHTRSAFLQGLLLQPTWPELLAELAEGFSTFKAICQLHELDAITGCLAFLRQLQDIDHVLVGVTTLTEWNEVAASWQRVAELPAIDFSGCNMAPHRLLNPANWPPRASIQ